DLTWNRIPGGSEIGKILIQTSDTFDAAHPDKSVPSLLKAFQMMEQIKSNPWVEEKKQDLLEVMRDCAGLWLEAIADRDSATRGSSVAITTKAINRSDIPMKLESVSIESKNLQNG